MAKAKNAALRKADRAKEDEFYTILSYIENMLKEILRFKPETYTIEDDSYTDDKGIVKGLLEFANVRALYKAHTKNAETVDYYHSKNPE